ncbi:MAG: amidohydrolase [Planctomycetes bacterium]|nr:amidohydrolase [Planctomycetota bacterium]
MRSVSGIAALAVWFVAIVVMPSGCAVQTRSWSADLILHNARIWTVDDRCPTAEAVAVRGNHIAAVGKNQDILRYQGPRTKVIDLRGAFVLPGFNDSHVHFDSAARFLEFNIMSSKSQDEFIARVRRVVDALSPGEWILGGYWGAYDRWIAGSAGGEHRSTFTPDMRQVDAITFAHPMFIQKFDASEYAANTAAIRAAGIDPIAGGPDNLEFVLDDRGMWTGILRGRGVRPLFERVIPRERSRARRLQQTRHALAEAARQGVTSLSDMSDDEQLEIYRELHEAGELTVRVHFRYPLDRWSELADRGIKIGHGDEWIRLGALKGHIDGIMGASSARFLEPYSHEPNNRGRWRRLMVDKDGRFVEGKFLQYMLDADRAGLQLTVHAIGDEANRLLLDYLDELNRKNGHRDRRFRLVHAQVMTPQDMKRLGKLGVIAEVQPYHLSDDMRWMEDRIGKERCQGAYAFKSIEDNGALLCFGSDWPGTSASDYPINPLLGIYAAVTRQTVSGEPKGGWFPDERISTEQAIRAYTYNGAYASFEEDMKGSIAIGKLADIVVLSENLLEIEPRALLDVDVLYTIVGGRIVFEKTK